MSLIHQNKPKAKPARNIRKFSNIHSSLNSEQSGLKPTVEKICPLCRQKAFVYTTCFDCKQPIQWICYKCTWESNLRVHDACHKNVTIHDALEEKNNVRYGLREKLEDIYRMIVQKISMILNLYY